MCHVDEATFGLSRNELVAVMEAENIFARRYFNPSVHKMAPYCSRAQHQQHLPVSEFLATVCLVLPTGASLSFGDIENVVSVVRWAYEMKSEIRQHLQAHPPLETLVIPFEYPTLSTRSQTK